MFEHADIAESLRKFFSERPEVVFAYLFGSQARGEAGPLSDLDVAVFLDESLDMFDTRLVLMTALAKALRTERFDLVVLNRAAPLLAYVVIKDGVVVKEDRRRRLAYEIDTIRTYLDTAYLRRLHREAIRDHFTGRSLDG